MQGRLNMKLQDALKKIIKEFGMSVLKEKRLVSILADYKVFDDYPAAKQVMKSIVEDGYGKELCRLGMDGSSDRTSSQSSLIMLWTALCFQWDSPHQ